MQELCRFCIESDRGINSGIVPKATAWEKFQCSLLVSDNINRAFYKPNKEVYQGYRITVINLILGIQNINSHQEMLLQEIVFILHCPTCQLEVFCSLINP